MTGRASPFAQQPVYIVDGARTPFIKAKGKPGPFSALELAVQTGQGLLARQSFDANSIDEVILGCVSPSPDESNIARLLALRLGLPPSTPAWTVQRNCASGMQSIDSAARNIALGQADLALAGGTEAMSRAPLLFHEDFVHWLASWSRSKTFMAKLKQLRHLPIKRLAPVIGLLRGLRDPIVGLSMGQTAEELAWKFDISRSDMDAFAMRSHERLAAAQADLNEILPIFASNGDVYQQDDGLRTDCTNDKLASLKPVFDKPLGNITAGNSAQVTDGAALLLLASQHAVDSHGLSPLAKIMDVQWAGLAPDIMGLGPVHAMAPIFQRQQLNTHDIDVWEINEAFAAQVLACLKAWQDEGYCKSELGLEQAFDTIPQNRLNKDGGAISIGHPVGASGARIILHTVKRLIQDEGDRGMASLCIGGGQGGAVLLQRVCGGKA